MKINIERWKSTNDELAKQKRLIVDQFEAINTPTPEDIANFELQRVQNQREINLHAKDLNDRLHNEGKDGYKDEFLKLELILVHESWDKVQGSDYHLLTKTPEQLIAYEEALKAEYDQALEVYNQYKPAPEDTVLNYKQDGKEYSANPDVRQMQFDQDTTLGQVNHFLLETETGKEVTETLGKIQDKVEDKLFKKILAELVVGKNPNTIVELVKNTFIGSEITTEEILEMAHKFSNQGFSDVDAIDAYKAMDLMHDAIRTNREQDLLSYQEWSQGNPLLLASSDDSILSEAIADHKEAYEQYLEEQLSGEGEQDGAGEGEQDVTGEGEQDGTGDDVPDYFDEGTYVEGTDGNDFLEGTNGDDVLEGGEGFDVLEGGEGFDDYIANDGDFINDSDSSGKVEFNGQDLSGEKHFNSETGHYEDNNFTYRLEGNDLEVVDKQTGESITIENWDGDSNEALGINLTDDDGKGSDPEHNDIDEDIPPDAFVPQEIQRHDPLALDINKDGFISTSSVAESTTYFDITGDGLRERVGWIKSEDALVAYDKNENGQIDGIGEVFGNSNENGFEELKRIADSNYDNIIDRKDELFNQLQVWNDFNQDAKVQEGELQNLQDAGVRSIDLNYVSTDIIVSGNLLSEASRYTDSEGNRELAADIQLAADVKDTKVEISDIPDFTIDETTRLLPQIKGSGLVYDSFILSNLDENFKAVAQELHSGDMFKVIADFETFVEHYSGYIQFVDEMQTRYSVDDFEMVEEDKQAWIVERFDASNKFTPAIENYYHHNLNLGFVPQNAVITQTDLQANYRIIVERLESIFALQSIFKGSLDATNYDLESGSFVIDDAAAFESQVVTYFNNTDTPIDQKLYLAEMMHYQMQHADLVFDVNAIVNVIEDITTQKLARDIYLGQGVSFLQAQEHDSSNRVVIGSEADEFLETGEGKHKILLGKGNDRVISGEGSQIYYFRAGDGADTIYDQGGVDKLVFAEGINRDDVTVKLQRNADLVIGVNESGKNFEELTNKITIVDWMRPDNRVDIIEFSDGATLNFQDVFEQFETTDGVEVVQLSSGNDILDTKGGDDVIKASEGNDTLIGSEGNDRLEGGVGNDTYYYERGHGKDTIIDSAGYDTLQFAEGVRLDDLIVKFSGTDLLIALKEEGVEFERLSDVITLKNYANSASTIEAIYLAGYERVNVQKLLNAPTEGDDNLGSSPGNTVVDLLAGNDFIATGDGANYIYGNLGNDEIITNDGNDFLEGGKGDDKLEGGLGNDTYIFNRGDGKDTIYDDYSFGFQDSQKGNAGNDTLYFGKGITAEDVEVQYFGPDLMIGIKEVGTEFNSLSDVVIIKNYQDENNFIENIEFSDGSILLIEPGIKSSDGDDNINLSGATTPLQINALAGQDSAHTGSADDNLNGGSGNDDLYAGAGNDFLTGGRGSDFVLGGSGDDTYVYNLGDSGALMGQTDILLDDNRPDYFDGRAGNFGMLWRTAQMILSSDVEQISGGNDIIQFGEGISEEDISFSRGEAVIAGGVGFYYPGSNDLIITISKNGTGRVIVREHFNPFNSIEKAVLADGTVIELPKADVVIDKGDDFYSFNRGDGHLVIEDMGGVDSLTFGVGIFQSDLIGRKSGSDFIIGLKEAGKEFLDLTDTVRFKNYTKSFNKIELIQLFDGSEIYDLDVLRVATQQNDSLTFSDGNRAINLLAGNDTITIESGNNRVNGGAGQDSIRTGAGSDVLTGGLNNDFLKGGEGDDFYIFNRGDGIDVIFDEGGSDVFQFGEEITLEDVVARTAGNDLILALNEVGKSFDELSDKVIIEGFISDNNKRIEFIEFKDGSRFSPANFIKATVLNDNFNFNVQEQVSINLLAGDDVIYTGYQNDEINGNSGNDVILSSSGADVLIGGIGNDQLYGGYGNDTYIFNRGDGQDIVSDEGGQDQLVFGEGISYDNLAFKVEDNNLMIALKEDGKSFGEFSDKITITNWFNGDTNIETLQFSDNSSVDAATITHSILGANPDVLLSKNGAQMRGGLGEDTYVYKKGDFTVIVDDQFQGGDIQVDSGDDVLQFIDITREQISMGTQGGDLIIKIDAGHDTYTELKDYVVIRDWQDVNRGIESIVFADGEVLTIDKTSNYPELVFDENWITSRYYIYGAEDNSISGSEFAEVIEAGQGDDVVNAHDGNDRLVGQAGNDTLYGGAGDDVYVFTRGDGHDTVFDTSGVDTLVFNGGIVAEEVLFEQDGNDLIVALKDDGKTFADLADKIVLKDWYTDVDSRVEYLALDGQDVIAIADLLITPTEQNDTLEYGDENNQISALSGDDVIHIGGGNDVIAGNGGDDQLYAGAGDDVVSGDAGTDSLYGAEGNDTYLFGRGDGQDTVIEDNFDDWGRTGTDTLQFKEGVSAEDVILVQQGDDLVVGLVEEGKPFDQFSDKITLKKWSTYDQENSRDYSRAYYAVEQFSFADGTVWNMADIIANINTDGDDSIHGFNQNDTLAGSQGNDELYGRLGDDTYVFNRGDGHDTIYDYARKGDEHAYYDAGNDTLKFGEGIQANDLIFIIEENKKDLLVYIKEEGKDLSELNDTILIKDWTQANTSIESFMLQDGTVLDLADYLTIIPTENSDILIYSNDSDYVDALAGDDIVFAQGGNDIVLGNTGNDDIQGGSGQDTLIGGEGDDVLSGGLDDDRLEGETGNDTYVFTLGDGHDVINDFTQALDEIDTVRFGADISQDQVSIVQTENHLTIQINDDNSVRIENWFVEDGYKVEKFLFEDGELDIASVEQGLNPDPYIVPKIMEQRVNVNPSSTFSPHIATLNDGNYAVAWGSGNYYTFGEEDVYSQLYSSDGNQIGSEQLVNSYITASQLIEDMVSLHNGGYVIVWRSANRNSFSDGVYLQQFSNSGEKIGSEKQVNTYTDSTQWKPTVTPLNDGGYVVAWEYFNQDSSGSGVYLQQFSNAGEKVGTETQVNTYTDGNQSSPIIISLENGGYVVAWNSDGQDGSVSGVFLHQFDALGNTIGSEQQVNTYTEGQQRNPEITALAGGSYVVVWTSSNQDGSHNGLYSQQFSAFGEKIGSETLVNTYTEGNQVIPVIRALNDGGYVIAWNSNGQDGDGNGVFLQQFNRFGEKVKPEQQVSTTTSGNQSISNISILDDGSFVVIWKSSESYYSGSDVFAQKFDASGSKQGDEQQINLNVQAELDQVDIASLDNGGYAVVFNSVGGIPEAGIYLQQFDSQGQRIGEERDPSPAFVLSPQQTITGNLDYIQDPDGDVLSYSASAENGDFIIGESGQWSYTSSNDFAGTENVVITVNDGNGGVLQHTLTFNVEMRMASPLVLDLNDNDITSIALSDSNAYFDYDGDGNREHTAWQEIGDAQLVADLNFDGQISDGSEIFGDYTLLADGTRAQDGYEALEQYDSNADRVIDNKDDFFGNLSLWQDHNQNGKSEAGELTNIQLSQVEAIHLDQANGITFEQRQENGNIILNETNYIGVDGSTGIIRDVGFVYNALDTITNNDTLSTSFYGQSLSGEEGDDVYLFNAGDGVVTVNDNGDGLDTLVFGEGIAPDQLVVRWDKANNGLVIGVKENADDDRSIFDLNDKIVMVDFFAESGAIENFEFADGASLSRESLYQQYTALAESQALTARVLDANENLAGGDFADVLYGAEGEEKLEGFAGNDYLRGLSGDDYLLAGSGNDTLEGGLGDDTLYSESGDDYYIYNRGDGKDLIQDFSGDDRLVLGTGISADDVVIEQEGYDLLVGLKEEGKLITELEDVIRIEGQFISGFQIEQIEFDDGSTIPLPSSDEPAGGSNSVVPEIEALSETLNEDESISGQLQVSGNTSGLIYEVVTDSDHASFSIDENGLYSYTPSENYHGTDTVTIKVTNDQGQSDTSTLTFDVESVNDAPVINVEEALFTLQDIREQNGEVQATDIESDALSYRVTTEAQHGAITMDENGAWNYKVDGYYLGEDSATITVEDGNGGVVTQTLKFEAKVTAPSLLDTSSQLHEDTHRTGSLNVNNPMGGALLYEVVTSSENGSFSVDESGNWNYEPDSDFNGSDSVVLKVTNEYGLSTSSSLTFEIDAVNDIPVVVRDVENLILMNIREYEGSIEASDVDGDSLLYSVQATPNHGSIVIDEVGRWNYVADAAFNGEDSAVILIDDGQGGSVTKNLNFTVEGYVYQGQDLVIDDTSGGDTLAMEGIDKSDLQFKRQGDDLAIQVKDEATVTLSHYFVDTQAGVGTLLTDQGDISLAREAIGGVTNWFGRGFGAGEVGSKNLIDGSSRRDTIYGKHENDVLFGENGSDVIWGLGGDDTLIGGNQHDILFGNWGADTLFGDAHNDYLSGGRGNDTLIGGTGKDILLGGRDNDTLIGGTGNDVLKGGRGDDLYVLSKGDNVDTITEFDGLDRIHFSEGVTKEDISFYMKDSNLHLQYGDNDRVTVQGQSQDKTKIERVELDDGSYLSNADIDLIIQQISAYSADSGIGQFDNNDIRNNEPMMQIIVSSWQQ